jgi:hypothetical protein
VVLAGVKAHFCEPLLRICDRLLQQQSHSMRVLMSSERLLYEMLVLVLLLLILQLRLLILL